VSHVIGSIWSAGVATSFRLQELAVGERLPLPKTAVLPSYGGDGAFVYGAGQTLCTHLNLHYYAHLPNARNPSVAAPFRRLPGVSSVALQKPALAASSSTSPSSTAPHASDGATAAEGAKKRKRGDAVTPADDGSGGGGGGADRRSVEKKKRKKKKTRPAAGRVVVRDGSGNISRLVSLHGQVPPLMTHAVGPVVWAELARDILYVTLGARADPASATEAPAGEDKERTLDGNAFMRPALLSDPERGMDSDMVYRSPRATAWEWLGQSWLPVTVHAATHLKMTVIRAELGVRPPNCFAHASQRVRLRDADAVYTLSDESCYLVARDPPPSPAAGEAPPPTTTPRPVVTPTTPPPPTPTTQNTAPGPVDSSTQGAARHASRVARSPASFSSPSSKPSGGSEKPNAAAALGRAAPLSR